MKGIGFVAALASTLALAPHLGWAETSGTLECITTGQSASGARFRYRIHGAGSQSEEAVAFTAEPLIDISMDGRPIVSGRPLVYDNAGAGHVYYALAESVYGLLIDMSSFGASVSVRHTVGPEDVIDTERGRCELITETPRPVQGYRCNIFNSSSASGTPGAIFYTEVLNLELVSSFCRSWMRERYSRPRNFRVDWVAELPRRPEREMVCGHLQPTEDGEFSIDSGDGFLRLVELSRQEREIAENNPDSLPSCVIGRRSGDELAVDSLGYYAL